MTVGIHPTSAEEFTTLEITKRFVQSSHVSFALAFELISTFRI